MFSIMDTIPTFFPMHILLILSCLECSLIQCNIIIYATLSLFSCWHFTAQHLVPYVGLIVPETASLHMQG